MQLYLDGAIGGAYLPTLGQFAGNFSVVPTMGFN